MADGARRTRPAQSRWLCLALGLLACSPTERVTKLGLGTTSKPPQAGLVVADGSDAQRQDDDDAPPHSKGLNRYLPLGAPPANRKRVRAEVAAAAKRASRCGLSHSGSVTVVFRENGTVRHVEINSGAYAPNVAACIVAMFRAVEVDAFSGGAVSVPTTIDP